MVERNCNETLKFPINNKNAKKFIIQNLEQLFLCKERGIQEAEELRTVLMGEITNANQGKLYHIWKSKDFPKIHAFFKKKLCGYLCHES